MSHLDNLSAGSSFTSFSKILVLALVLICVPLIVLYFQSFFDQLLVVSRNLCWAVTCHAHLVVIMDTLYYEGKIHT